MVDIEGKGNVSFDDIKHLVSGARGKQVFDEGDINRGVWTAGNLLRLYWVIGQVVGLIDDIPSCQELCSRMVAEAEEILEEKMKMVVKAKL